MSAQPALVLLLGLPKMHSGTRLSVGHPRFGRTQNPIHNNYSYPWKMVENTLETLKYTLGCVLRELFSGRVNSCIDSSVSFPLDAHETDD